ncbi:MAG: acyloxyacyl hydrolase [Pedobacter sp.]|nr:acyloxyacyl hydrolase [Pedobacter sp.]
MQKSYFEVNLGYINYPFSAAQLEPGYSLNSVTVPHMAVRLVLWGYNFNDYLSTQVTYMRPVAWVKYSYKENGDNRIYNRSVWTNVGGFTLKGNIPIASGFTAYGEAGLGIITRAGFNDSLNRPVVKDANYATFLFGAGLKYKLDEKWNLQLITNYSPASNQRNQPYTSFVGTGFAYTFAPYNERQLKKTKDLGMIHPKQWLQIGYTSNILGYGVNNLVSNKYFPIFWGGMAHVKQGLSINYQRNVFHSAKVFALDWGINASVWQTTGKHNNTQLEKQNFFTFSIFPVFRLNFLHTPKVDAYFYYTVAAPSFISEKIIDGFDTGKHFTFMDNMGAGVFFGKQRNYNAELKIGHYSNGNIFPSNDAVKIPLSLNLGYAF